MKPFVSEDVIRDVAIAGAAFGLAVIVAADAALTYLILLGLLAPSIWRDRGRRQSASWRRPQ